MEHIRKIINKRYRGSKIEKGKQFMYNYKNYLNGLELLKLDDIK